MSWQLIAHADEDICDVIGKSVQRALKRHKVLASIDAVQNIESVAESLAANGERDLDLVVLSSTIPVDAASSVGMTGRDPTQQLIRKLKQRRPSLPVIVVANTPDDRLAGFLDAFDRTGIVTVGNDLDSTLIERVAALYQVQASATDDGCVELNIHLGGERFGSWDMRRTGCKESEDSGCLQVDGDLLKRLIRDSKKVNLAVASDSTEWLEDVNDLSSNLRQLLFRNGNPNIDCWDRFLKQREQVGGVSRSRICITVNDETHAMLFEALRDSGMDSDESWILNAPVFRRYAQQMNFPPLFADAASRNGPVDCLVVEADESYGRVAIGGGDEEEFQRLELLSTEASAIATLLEDAALGDVHHLRIDAAVADPLALVLEKLRERQWHIVHFCGHVGGGAANPSLVLRATPDGILPVQRLTRALNRTQLLFLSSCHSAQTQIVMHAVERSVSALVGFQWVIEDRAALEFATDFYRLLLDATDPQARHLEHALLAARKKAYRRKPSHPSWMAPVLVMQMG